MKTGSTILFILNIVALMLLAYFTFYEMEHNGMKSVIILLIILTAVSIFTLFKLYSKNISSPAKNSDTHHQKEAR